MYKVAAEKSVELLRCLEETSNPYLIRLGAFLAQEIINSYEVEENTENTPEDNHQNDDFICVGHTNQATGPQDMPVIGMNCEPSDNFKEVVHQATQAVRTADVPTVTPAPTQSGNPSCTCGKCSGQPAQTKPVAEMPQGISIIATIEAMASQVRKDMGVEND